MSYEANHMLFRSNRTHLTMMSFEEQDDASSLVPSSTTMSFDEEDSFLVDSGSC
jgi:hypothetical protein